MRVAAAGKSFVLDGSPFRFRGVTYSAALDLAEVTAAGYTVVDLPSIRPQDVEHAIASDLRFMLELDIAALTRSANASRRERKIVVSELAARIRPSIQPWRASDALLGLVIGSRVRDRRPPASADIAARVADELAATLHEEDPGLLVAWRDAWPLHGQCPAEFDFLMVDVEISTREQLASAILACHAEIGDRPLVLAGLSLSGEIRRGDPGLTWLIEIGLRCGVAGTVTPAPSRLEASLPRDRAAFINRRTVRDLEIDWPSISVVVTAYNSASTIEECLSHCDRLEYPGLEVVVVDDGSTDATPAIVATHTRARLITIPRSGLPAARNAGYRFASGELIAFLDADAYPSPEWPWYLALAAREQGVGGSGGPNVPPPKMPVSARIAARSPGSTVPQLLGPDRARHLPGCNMAYWRHVLEQLQGFDPALEGAEDLEFEWRVMQAGYELGYHPAALVWHRRRPGLRGYLRQQSSYGRHYAIFERRYPERFPSWLRLKTAASRLRPHGSDGRRSAPFPVRYLTLPAPESALLGLAHDWGLPVALALCAAAPFGLVRRKLAVPSVAAAAFMGALFSIDFARAGQSSRRSERGFAFRSGIAAFRLLRPLAFRWGHARGSWNLRRGTPGRS
ncbi:MAG: glycosyltransferase [Solirubrobacterales bacterium]|nr:glycosyltransferase [Solirubrobacterales bacterium]